MMGRVGRTERTSRRISIPSRPGSSRSRRSRSSWQLLASSSPRSPLAASSGWYPANAGHRQCRGGSPHRPRWLKRGVWSWFRPKVYSTTGAAISANMFVTRRRCGIAGGFLKTRRCLDFKRRQARRGRRCQQLFPSPAAATIRSKTPLDSDLSRISLVVSCPWVARESKRLADCRRAARIGVSGLRSVQTVGRNKLAQFPRGHATRQRQ